MRTPGFAGFAVLALMGCSRHDDPVSLAPAGVEVEQRVFRGANAGVTDEYGHTALHLAVYRSDAALARAALASGAQVDVRDRADLTPLMIAAGAGACDVAHVLLSAGADVNATSGPQRLQPVHLAALQGTPEMLELLLAHGADPSARDAWGRTPLHLVTSQEWIRAAALARRLADAGADLSAKDDRGFIALHAAAESDCVPIVDLYSERAPSLLAAATPTQVDALDIALDYDAQLVSDALFAAGVSPALRVTREPPLLEAARFDDRARAEHVLAFRKHPVDSYRGRSVIDVARAAGRTEMVALLEAYGLR
jgi:ankyrin repeat protein